MSSITLPCGCRINEGFVLGMCITHVIELRQQQEADDAALERYQEMLNKITDDSTGKYP